MPNTINIEVSVARVHSGGNANNGRYFYSFDQDLIMVSETSSIITFTLNADALDFQIVRLVASDGGKQLINQRTGPEGRSMSVVDTCESSELISIALLVRDLRTGAIVVCDPQVLNSPD